MQAKYKSVYFTTDYEITENYDVITCSCEHDNETWVPLKGGKGRGFTDCWLLKKDFAAWR
jgi:hypothetical protein